MFSLCILTFFFIKQFYRQLQVVVVSMVCVRGKWEISFVRIVSPVVAIRRR